MEQFLSLCILINPLIRFEERNFIQYPSISVCMEYTFKKYIDHKFNDPNISFEDTVKLIDTNHWKLNESFYFLNHKIGPMGDFPCMTIKESVDPGRPCYFPFLYDAGEALLSLKNER